MPFYQIKDRVLGRFEIAAFLGTGGVGEVYHAREDGDDVALKVLHPRVVPAYVGVDKIRSVLFEQLPEEDPCVLPKEVIEEEGRKIIVSSFARGMDLRRILDAAAESAEGRFDATDVFHFVVRLLDRLSELPPFAVHGALKPQNIVVDVQEAREFADAASIRITDLHLHRVLSFSKYATIQLAHPPAYSYLAPEFVSQGGRVDHRADVYSVGVLAFELATGSTPTKEKSSLAAAGFAGPKDLDRVIAKALAASPEERFANFGDFQAAIRHAFPVLAERLSRAPISLASVDLFTGVEEEQIQVDVGGIGEVDVFAEGQGPVPARPAEPSRPDELDHIAAAFDQALAGDSAPFPGGGEPGLPQETPETLAAARPPRPASTGDTATRWSWLMLGAAAVLLLFIVYRHLNVEPPEPAEGIPFAMTPTPVAVAATTTTTTTTETSTSSTSSTSSTTSSSSSSSTSSTSKASTTSTMSTTTTTIAAAMAPSPSPSPAGVCATGMALVPAGTFRVGSAPDDPMRQEGEPTNLNTYVDAFCVDLYEYPNQPGVKPKAAVSLTEAKAACMKVGKYLCSEKEWEKACKGGTDNRRFPYGNEFVDATCATQSPTGENRGVSAGGHWKSCRSAYGVYDMSGNVQEWTATPIAPGAPSFVIKGGDGFNPAYAARCAFREAAAPSTARERLGFRCCGKPAI